jgi:hypothetical protein
MKHPLPWHTAWAINVHDAEGRFVCEAVNERAAKEIVAVSALAFATLGEIRRQGGEACPLGLYGPSAAPAEAAP